MVVLLEGSPISTEDLSLTIDILVTSLTKVLLPRLLSLAGRPALGRFLTLWGILCRLRSYIYLFNPFWK